MSIQLRLEVLGQDVQQQAYLARIVTQLRSYLVRPRVKKVPLRLHACRAEFFVRCCGRTAANLTRRRMPIDAAGGATRRKFNIFHPVSPDCAVAPQAITLAAERPRHTISGRCSRQECCACGGGAGTPESISSQLLP